MYVKNLKINFYLRLYIIEVRLEEINQTQTYTRMHAQWYDEMILFLFMYNKYD